MNTQTLILSFIAASGLAALGQTNPATPNTPAPLPKAPSGVQFKPYGWIKFDAVYDSAKTSFGDIGFWVLPGSAAGGDQEELTFGARYSRLGVNLVAPEYDGIQVAGRIEGDFYEEAATANKYSPQLRLAYLDAAWGDGWSIRAGQDWDTHINFHPRTVDAATLGNTGHLYRRHPQVRLTKATALEDGSILTAKIAAQHGRNTSDVDQDAQADENASATPGLHASLVLQTKLLTDKFSTFTLSGAYGREKLGGVETVDAGEYESVFVHAGVQLPVTRKLTLQGVIWTGENLDNYLGGVGQGVNAAAGTEVQAYGGWAQGVYEIDAHWSASLGYGIDNPNDDDLAGDARTSNERLFTNVFYKLTDRVTLSTEYSHFTTAYATSGDVTDHRAQFAAQLDF